MLLISLFLCLGMQETQDSQKNLTTQNLIGRVSAYLKDADNLNKKEIADFKLKIEKCNLNISVIDNKISIVIEFPKDYSAADIKQLETVFKEKVIKDVLGQFMGGLVDQASLQEVTNAIAITLREKAPSTPNPNTPNPNEQPSIFDLDKFKQRLAEFMNDPEKKAVVDSLQGAGGKLLCEATELDKVGRLVLKMRLSQEPPKSERDRILDLLKNRIVSEVLGNYRNPPLALQAEFPKFLGSLQLEIQSKPPKPPVAEVPNSKPNVAREPQPFIPSAPENVSELMGKAIRALKVYESAFALRLLNYVLSVEPENPVAWKLRAIAQYDLGLDMEAVASARWADRLARGIPGALDEISRAMESIQGKRRDFLEMVRLMDIGRTVPIP